MTQKLNKFMQDIDQCYHLNDYHNELSTIGIQDEIMEYIYDYWRDDEKLENEIMAELTNTKTSLIEIIHDYFHLCL
jgi:hypothetical protein